jgi:hypothetical protein
MTLVVYVGFSFLRDNGMPCFAESPIYARESSKWVLTCIVSPAARRRCCPIGESVGSALVVNLRVSPVLVSFEVLVEAVPNMPPTLRLLLVLGGESGLFE